VTTQLQLIIVIIIIIIIKYCANIYFNQQYLFKKLIPNYANTKIPYTFPATKTIQKKVLTIRLNDAIKFLYIKNKLFVLLWDQTVSWRRPSAHNSQYTTALQRTVRCWLQPTSSHWSRKQL